MRDHGGNIDQAMQRFGGSTTDWIDLSTGINRVPYPLPDLPTECWTALPTQASMAALTTAAQRAFATTAPIAALAGAQSAIQMIPLLRLVGEARVLAPTYNEHSGALAGAGWQVREVPELAELAGADLVVVVNPNNPDGQRHSAEQLLALAQKVGLLIVDESFADPQPEHSLAAQAGQPGLIVLRSFGKFYGLAGLRLGFALGAPEDIAALKAMAGPWPISGAAIAIGTEALANEAWAKATTARLTAETARLDDLARKAGWQPVGGTELFRLVDTPDAAAAQERLARHHIWSRIFPYSARWLRLGLPGGPAEWARLEAALRS